MHTHEAALLGTTRNDTSTASRVRGERVTLSGRSQRKTGLVGAPLRVDSEQLSTQNREQSESCHRGGEESPQRRDRSARDRERPE